MKLTLQRTGLKPYGMIGDLSINGMWRMFTVERDPADPIQPCPVGTYPVTLRPTYNSRLWSPMPDRWLPHIENVPGRTGIEIHSGNTAADTHGCVIVGLDRTGTMLIQSRHALTMLMELLKAADGTHDIEIRGIS